MLRFDPFRELDRMADQLSRPSGSVLSFDAVRDDNEITLYFDVPGVHADDVEVSVEKNELTIKVERSWAKDGKTVLASERSQGTFTRQLILNDALDTDALEANLNDGVLVVTVPVDETAKQRRIEVQAGGKDTQAIETSSKESEAA